MNRRCLRDGASAANLDAAARDKWTPESEEDKVK